MKEKIHKILININENQLKDCKLAQISIETLENNILKKSKKESKKDQEIESVIIEYLTEVLLKNILKNPASKLYSALIKPYIKIYEEVNSKYKIESTLEIKTIFYRITIFHTLKNSQENIKSNYINTISPYIKKEINRHKNLLDFLEENFSGNKNILRIVIGSLEVADRNHLKNMASKSEVKSVSYEELIKKITNGMRCYFLLRWKGMSYTETTGELSCIFVRKNILKDLEQLQLDFYKTIPLNIFTIKQEIEKLKNTDEKLYCNIKLFLGEIENIYPVSEKELLEQVEIWKKRLIEKYKKVLENKNIFDLFEELEYSTIKLIIECFRNEEPIFYEIILRKCGKDLLDWKSLDLEEETLFLKAIDKIKEILKNIKEENLYIDDSEKLFIPLNNKKNTSKNNDKNLFSNFPEEQKIDIINTINYLKNISPRYYEVIKKCHGESLQEWNELSQEENVIYQSAIAKLKIILQNLKSVSPKNTLFTKFKDNTEEEVRKALENLKQIKPEYYEAIIKRHGENLTEWHELSQKENIIYMNTFRSLKKELQNLYLEPVKKTIFTKFKDNTEEEVRKALENLKQIKPEYYEAIIKRHGENLTEWHELSQKENTIYQNAIVKLKTILRNLKSVSPKNTLFTKFKDNTEEEVRKALENLKQIKPEYYEAIIKRHGENFKEWHELSQKENTIYQSAIVKLKTILRNLKSVSPKNILFTKFKDNTEEEVRKALENLKQINPKYYEVIIKRHSDSLEEWNILSQEENTMYQRAITKLKIVLQNPKFYLEKKGIFAKLSDYSKEEIRKAINNLKQINLEYYKIIIKRHGENLTEWHVLSQKDNIIYMNAFRRLKKELQNLYLEPVKKTIFTKFKDNTEEEIKNAINILKTINPEYYKIIIKRHSDSLEEWNILSQEENTMYQCAITKLKIVLQNPKFYLEKKGIFAKLSDYSKEEIRKAINNLKQINLEYYKIIIKRHGENLMEWNTFSQQENILYRNAICKLKVMLQSPKLKEEKNLFSKFPNNTKMEIINAVNSIRETNPKYHEIIIKRYGELLNEWHVLSQQEKILYENAITKLKKELDKRKKIQKLLIKESLLANKININIIKEKRRGADTNTIAERYHINKELIYQIYANNLILFGAFIPDIIQEILLNSPNGNNYLMNSNHYQFLYLNQLPDESIILARKE